MPVLHTAPLSELIAFPKYCVDTLGQKGECENYLKFEISA